LGKVENKYGRGGFTLIELLVYIAIMGFVIIVAGRAFSDSTGMRLRSQSMLSSAEEAGRVSAILKEDVSQMGAKSWGYTNAYGTDFDTVASVHINFNNGRITDPATDLSSYILVKGAKYDALMFRKAHYSEYGICQAVMQIEWSVRESDSVLIRKCEIPPPGVTLPGTCNAFDDDAKLRECPPVVEMASGVTEFRFLPSRPGAGNFAGITSDTLFPFTPGGQFSLIMNGISSAVAFPPGGGEKITLSGFEQNPSSEETSHANFYIAEPGETDCSQMYFMAGEEYAMSFEMPCALSACRKDNSEKFNPMVMFQPGVDHLSVGLRDVTSGEAIAGISDFLFYPPQDMTSAKIRHFEFSVLHDITACIGITAAFYSQAAKGRLEIGKFKVYRKFDNVYHFDKSNPGYNPDVATDPSRALVKAFELTLGINRRGEINHTTTVIPVPNNGVVMGGN